MFRRRRAPADFEAEVAVHLELETDRLVQEGMAVDEARAAARRTFGSRIGAQERFHDTGRWLWLDRLVQDARYATRGLRRWPGTALLVVLMLALGTGITTAVVSVASDVLLAPLPYADSDRLVLVSPARIDGAAYRAPCTARQCLEWQRAAAFDSAAAYFWVFDYLVSRDGSTSLEGLAVSHDYFRVTGLQPVIGRTFHASERSPRTHPVVLISHRVWRQQFNGDPSVLGRSLMLGRHRALTIVGVMPPGVRFLPAPMSESSPGYDLHAMVDFWVPEAPAQFPPDVPIWNVVARLRSGAPLEQAQAEIAAIAARQADTTPAFRGLTARVVPVQAALNRGPAAVLIPLLGSAACILLIACTNAAALQLARGLRRRVEFGVQAALGAGPGRLVRQIVGEHAILGLLSAALGGLLAYAALPPLLALAGSSIGGVDAVSIDLRLVAWSVCLALVTALGAGIPMALRVSGSAGCPGSPGAALFDRGGAHRTMTPGGSRMLQILTGAQIALTLALLTGAGLLLRSFHHISSVEPGFETRRLLTMMVTDVGEEDWHAFHRRALDRVEALPGVTGAAFAWGLPLTNTGASTRVRFGDEPDAAVTMTVRAVTSSYFDLLRIDVIEGRAFREADGPDAGSVAIVNASAARRHVPHGHPVGRTLIVPGWPGERRTIVGVVADVRADALTRTAEPEVYLPLSQATAFSKHLVVRTAASSTHVAGAVERALRTMAPTVAVESMKTLDQIRVESSEAQTFATVVTAVFAAAAVLLAATGIYGAMAWAVSRRQREFAIRMALGADARRILRAVLADVQRPLIVGIAFGVALAAAGSKSLQAWLFGVAPGDLTTHVAAAVLVVVVTLGAAWLPSRRAVGCQANAVLQSD